MADADGGPKSRGGRSFIGAAMVERSDRGQAEGKSFAGQEPSPSRARSHRRNTDHVNPIGARLLASWMARRPKKIARHDWGAIDAAKRAGATGRARHARKWERDRAGSTRCGILRARAGCRSAASPSDIDSGAPARPDEQKARRPRIFAIADMRKMHL